MGLMQTIKSSSKRAVTVAKDCAEKHGPQAAIYAGLGTVIIGGIFACKQTLTVDEVKKKHAEKLQEIEDTVKDNDIPEYTEEKAKKDKTKVMVAMGTDILKHYALPLGLVTAGSGGIIWGTNKMSKKIGVLTASVGTLTAFISDYRGRVREVVGEEVENDIFLGKKKVEVVDEKTGKVTTEYKMDENDILKNPFVEFWQQYNSDGRMNGLFDPNSGQMNAWNATRYENMYQEKMESALARGEVAVLYVNDIYKDFDIPVKDSAKAVARRDSGWAWIKDENGKIISLTGGATRISLGLPRKPDGSVRLYDELLKDKKGNVIFDGDGKPVIKERGLLGKIDYDDDPEFLNAMEKLCNDDDIARPILINPNCDGDITSALYEYYSKREFKSKN